MGKKNKKPCIGNPLGFDRYAGISKTPRTYEDVGSSSKIPRTLATPESLDKEKISWGVKLIEKGGPWGWSEIKRENLWGEILQKLGQYETMTWSEIKGRRNHSIKIESLSSKAQKRLKDISQDDIETLFSLHLDGKGRIFGIQERNVLKLLWWDPKHEVCPCAKK